MARLKRSSASLEQAIRRLAGSRSISETLDLGNGLSVSEYSSRIQALQTKLSDYNKMLSDVDEVSGQIQLMEQELRSYSEKMLLAVAARYGKESLQYVQAGSKQRKRSKRSSTIPTSTPGPTATIETTIIPPTQTANGNGNGTAAAIY